MATEYHRGMLANTVEFARLAGSQEPDVDGKFILGFFLRVCYEGLSEDLAPNREEVRRQLGRMLAFLFGPAQKI